MKISDKKDKKYKTDGCRQNKILIYGRHPLFSMLKSKKRKIYEVYVLHKNRQEFFDRLKNENIDFNIKLVQFVDAKKLNSIFPYQEKNHQGYIAYVGQKQKVSFDDFMANISCLKELPRLLILDQILDPHNLGAIIRTAVAFGIENIIITTHNSVKDTTIVAKTSVGLNELVNLIEVVNLNNTIKDLKKVGYFVIGLDGRSNLEINKITDSKNLALILGNEGSGIRELVKKNCDELVKIPMSNAVESLNVSVASAIAIYELWK